MNRRGIFLLAIVSMAVSLFSTVGCSITSRQRTLPPSIRTIAVPVAVNRSAEAGIEEELTILAQKEFLADGRLDLAAASDPDAWVEITIVEFDDSPVAYDSDGLPRLNRVEVEAEVRILRNLPGKPVFGGVRGVRSSATYNNDTRRITYEPKSVGRTLALKALARHVVREVMTGTYTSES